MGEASVASTKYVRFSVFTKMQSMRVHPLSATYIHTCMFVSPADEIFLRGSWVDSLCSLRRAGSRPHRSLLVFLAIFRMEAGAFVSAGL